MNLRNAGGLDLIINNTSVLHIA